MGAASFRVAGAAIGAPRARFAWQAQHFEHLHRGRRKSGDASFSWQAQHLEHLRLVLRGRRSIRSTSGSFCVAGAALGAPHARFAWQPQHFEHLHRVGGSPATIEANRRHLVLRGKRSTWSTSGSFCVAGAALGAPHARFAWQAQHFEHIHRGRRKSGDE